MQTRMTRWLIVSTTAVFFVTTLVAFSVYAQSSSGLNQEPGKTDPLQLPFGIGPSTRSLDSTQRMREALRDQDLRIDPDPNRRMFRPKQPEPGYSDIRPYSGADTPTRVRPVRPIP
jgi:hypothetical protein